MKNLFSKFLRFYDLKRYLLLILITFSFITVIPALAGCGEDEIELSMLDKSDGPVASLKEDAEAIAEIMENEEASAGGSISASQGNIEKNTRPETIFVHVCGAVNTPGVYELYAGSRVCEALLAAGDFRNDADSEYLNQAAVLSDGDKIYVPTLDETASGYGEGQISYADGAAGAGGYGGSDGSGQGQASDGLININTASISELKTLPGIGDVKAGAIVAYREANGKFKSVDEITKVPGVKSGLLEQIRNLICAR